MPLTLLQTVNFGATRSNVTGSSGVGYKVIDTTGTTVVARTTAGVFQASPGIYSANVTYPDRFNGQVVWDCPAVGQLPTIYASEDQNVQSNDPRVSETWQMVNAITGSIQALYDMSYGRWRIDKAANQMVFYKADNVTVVATFNLFDESGVPTYDGVFDRQKT